MKTIQKTMLLFGLLFGMLTGCTQNEIPSCDGEAVRVDVETIDCSLINISQSQKTVNLVVKSQEEFEKFVGCGVAKPAVDFAKYFLLAGRTKLSACGGLKEQRLDLKCDKLEFIIEIEKMACQAPTDVPYFAVVPREYANTPIVFTVRGN